MDMIRDIYGTHKVFMFGSFKFKEYSLDHLQTDITKSALTNKIDSKSLFNDSHIRSLSLYPTWLIHDDLFQIFAVHFAVSALVESWEFKAIGHELVLHCIVIPQAVVSLYDHDVKYEYTLNGIESKFISIEKDTLDIEHLVKAIAPLLNGMDHGNDNVIDGIDKALHRYYLEHGRNDYVDDNGDGKFTTFCNEVGIDEEVLDEELAHMDPAESLLTDFDDSFPFKETPSDYGRAVLEVIKMCRDRKCGNVLIIVDRRGETQDIHVSLDYDDVELHSFRTNHCISLRYHAQYKGKDDKTIKSWCQFGFNQCIRFWPEQLVWFIPQLFLRNNLSPQEYLERIYGNDYRHGFRTRLDDPVFNRYYKIVTGYDHESVNYYRSVMKQQHRVFQDELVDALPVNPLVRNLFLFLENDNFDSDAIFDDVAEARGAVTGQWYESNIVNHLQNQIEVSKLTSVAHHQKQLLHHLYKVTKTRNAACSTANVLEVWDCHYVQDVIRILEKFQGNSCQVDEDNLADYNYRSIIRGLDHLVTVHSLHENVLKIRAYIQQYVQCDFGNGCNAIHHQRSRQRERLNTQSTGVMKESGTNEMQSTCSVTLDYLSRAHCHLLHSAHFFFRRDAPSAKFQMEQFLWTSGGDEHEEMEDVEAFEDALMRLDWGKHVLEWLPCGTEPLFKSFMTEMLQNPDSTLTRKVLDEIRMECAVKVEEASRSGLHFSLEEMMCLKLYTDCTNFQKLFRGAHWKSIDVETKRKYYQWASMMYKTFLFHAFPIPPPRLGTSQKPQPLYHGLNRMFIIEKTTPTFYGPFSTTTSKQMVQNFSKKKGVEFTVQSSYFNLLRLVIGIQTRSISAFSEEQEILLHSQMLPITTTKTYEEDEKKRMRNLLFTLKNVKEKISNKKTFYKKNGVTFRAKWLQNLVQHRDLLLSKTVYRDHIVAYRMYNELEIETMGQFLLNYILENVENNGNVLHADLFWQNIGVYFDDHLLSLLEKPKNHSLLHRQSTFENRIVLDRLRDELNLRIEIRALNWDNLIQAANHENVAIGSVMESVLKENNELGVFEDSKSREDVSEAIKRKWKNITSLELAYIDGMLHRALDGGESIRQSMSTLDSKFSDPKISGLTKDLVRDIYGVHKVFIFGSFKFKGYEAKDFVDDIRNNIGNVAVSRFAANDRSINRLSLYPKWLIRDNLFQVFAVQFAVSHLVNSLEPKQIANGLSIHCIVIPHSAVSLYDRNVEFKRSIGDHARTGEEICNPLRRDMCDVDAIVNELQNGFLSFVNESSSKLIVLVDRRGDFQNVRIIDIKPMQSLTDLLKKFRSNHVVEMEYVINANQQADSQEWRVLFHFGDKQCIRFWPEQLVWFIPRLFLRENGNDYDYLRRIYHSDYKHGFCVNLKDEEFSRFYKILTGWDHQSVNYRRIPLGTEQRKYKESKEMSFRDFTETRLEANSASRKLLRFVNENGYDSDAIMDDVTAIGPVVDEQADSNIVITLNTDENGVSIVHHLLQLIPSYFSSRPCNGKYPVEHCPYFNSLIRNLRKFQAAKFQVDAGNIQDFDHLNIIRQMDHLVTVHKLFSDNNAAIRGIRDKIQCDFGEECSAFGVHRSHQREVIDDEFAAKCTETKYTLCSAHCYFLHSAKYLYRMRGDAKPLSMEVVEEKTNAYGDECGDGAPLSIDWGEHILQWLPFGESPSFKSFLEEMARNPVSTVGPRTLEFLRKESEVLIEGTEYELDEMMGLKAYSDVPKFQKKFRRAHFKRTELKIKKNFYHWASTMYKAFLFHSKPIQKKKEFDSPIPIYRGLDRMFTVDTATPSFQGPFSTTISDQVVRAFASDEGGRGRGLEFTLQSSYHNPLRFVTGINMIRISSFKHEQEILLYAQTVVISKTKVHENADGKLVDHLMSSVQKRETLITDKNTFYKRIGFKFKKKWINLVLKHPKLFANSEYANQMVVQRLQNELGIFRNIFTIHYGENNGLRIESTVKLEIMSSLKVPESGAYFRNTEDITISSNTVIGVEDENQNTGSNTAKYIAFDSSRRITNDGILQSNGSSGGVISLYAAEEIENNGKMECMNLNRDQSGGSVVIVSDGGFVNRGVVDCGIDGLVIIECNEFVNEGSITSEINVVVIGMEKTMESSTEMQPSVSKGGSVNLKVCQHRGHHGEYAPENLLKEGSGDFYISDRQLQPPSDDWIVFERNEELRFIPTAVIIRNNWNKSGIKRIAIYGGNDIDDLEEWVEIDGIHNDANRERQIFPIGSEQRYIAYIEQFKYFKLRILENHGNPNINSFIEFAILGVRLC